MSFDATKLYELLPSLYRIRDTALGRKLLAAEGSNILENITGEEEVAGPLKSLLTIIAEQIAVLEENLEQLYDDQFIETCAGWVVPYIGALVGTRGLIPIPGAPVSQRSEVANTIAYRRRKGTASIIEQLARDVTGWNANVVEYFQLLATTQFMNHLRPQNLSMASLKHWEMLEYANTPFNKMAHTVDVRRIEKKRGKYNIPNIGIFLWRINSYSLTKTPAYKVDDRRYVFNPLGIHTPLYILPVTEDSITHLAVPANVPMPLSRRVLDTYFDLYYGHDKKEALQSEPADETEDKSIVIYKNGQPVIPAATAGSPPVNPSNKIKVCNLGDIYDVNNIPVGWAHLPADTIAIDPVLGRIAFPQSEPPPATVHTTFYYGFSAEMGGGEYSRAATFTESAEPVIIEVVRGITTIQQALDVLAETGGIIEIPDNEYYVETPVIRIAKGKTIELRAADGSRPVLVAEGDIRVEAEENARCILNGIVISGGRIRLPLATANNGLNQLESLRILHCTLLPGASAAIGDVAAQPASPRILIECPGIILEIEKSITGPLRVFDGAKVIISNSIVDATEEAGIAYAGVLDDEPGASLSITNSTLIGKVNTIVLQLASNSIFIAGGVPSPTWKAPVMAQRLQQGCVRFSYFPPGSRIPRPYHCQPATVASAARVRPVFTSLQYGDAGYCQLAGQCAAEITTGADDGAEMGVFHDLYQPQRVANLRSRLDEYLRFGLEAGIFYAS